MLAVNGPIGNDGSVDDRSGLCRCDRLDRGGGHLSDWRWAFRFDRGGRRFFDRRRRRWFGNDEHGLCGSGCDDRVWFRDRSWGGGDGFDGRCGFGHGSRLRGSSRLLGDGRRLNDRRSLDHRRSLNHRRDLGDRRSVSDISGIGRLTGVGDRLGGGRRRCGSLLAGSLLDRLGLFRLHVTGQPVADRAATDHV